MSALSISSIQQHRPLVRRESVPQLAAFDIVADVVHAAVAELTVAQPRHRVVLVEALQRLGGRLDVPLDQGRADRLGDLDRQNGLAGARLAFDQERPFEVIAAFTATLRSSVAT